MPVPSYCVFPCKPLKDHKYFIYVRFIEADAVIGNINAYIFSFFIDGSFQRQLIHRLAGYIYNRMCIGFENFSALLNKFWNIWRICPGMASSSGSVAYINSGLFFFYGYFQVGHCIFNNFVQVNQGE